MASALFSLQFCSFLLGQPFAESGGSGTSSGDSGPMLKASLKRYMLEVSDIANLGFCTRHANCNACRRIGLKKCPWSSTLAVWCGLNLWKPLKSRGSILFHSRRGHSCHPMSTNILVCSCVSVLLLEVSATTSKTSPNGAMGAAVG